MAGSLERFDLCWLVFILYGNDTYLLFFQIKATYFFPCDKIKNIVTITIYSLVSTCLRSDSATSFADIDNLFTQHNY